MRSADELIASLAGTRALVLGGAGFVGSHLLDGLVAAGADRVAVVDDLSLGRRENLADALERRQSRSMSPTPASMRRSEQRSSATDRTTSASTSPSCRSRTPSRTRARTLIATWR
jgi:hypothetical protein